MLTDNTAGLSSPYQVTGHTATEELGYSLLDTGGLLAIPVIEVVGEKELAELIDSEVISIRISPEHEELAFYLLSKVSEFQSLPGRVYLLRRSDLGFLEEAGIAYEEI